MNLALPAHGVVALRVGNRVRLTWTTLNRTTDHTEATGPMRVQICRMEGTGPCETIEDEPVKLGTPGSYEDVLPTDLLQGQAKLLTYYIEVLNHARKSAGRSQAVFAVGGASVPQVTDVSAIQRPEGVELHWQPLAWPDNAQSARILRIVRTRGRAAASAEKRSNKGMPATTVEQPVQILEVAVAADAAKQATGIALDRSVRKGESYSYVMQGVERVTIDGKLLEMAGPQSDRLAVATRDTFPPGIPQDLSAAADTKQRAIDLSWSPDVDADLAGYRIYRRDVNSGKEAVMISGADPVQTPAFHDAPVEPGKKYAYSVSAVDAAGNESQRSQESVETLASQP